MIEEDTEKTTHNPGLRPEGTTNTYQNLRPWAISTKRKVHIMGFESSERRDHHGPRN